MRIQNDFNSYSGRQKQSFGAYKWHNSYSWDAKEGLRDIGFNFMTGRIKFLVSKNAYKKLNKILSASKCDDFCFSPKEAKMINKRIEMANESFYVHGVPWSEASSNAGVPKLIISLAKKAKNINPNKLKGF